MIKKLLTGTAIVLVSVLSQAQETGNTSNAKKPSFIGVTANLGFVLNSDMDKKLALGGEASYAFADPFFKSEKNFVTIGLKGMNNPYGEGKFISSMANNKNDGLNYISLLAGYRIISQSYENGFYAEPRIGITSAAKFLGFAFAPKVGYTMKKWDFSAFADTAFGAPENNLLKKSIFTAGIGIGYNFALK